MNIRIILSPLLALLGILPCAGQHGGVIGASDTVSIKVYREPDLDTVGELSPAGTISMPLLGSVKLSGMTTDRAARAIEARLRDGYLVRPQVTVAVIKRVVRTVTVLGQARQPGVFTLPASRRLTLVEVIGMAGGFTEVANARKVTLKSGSGGQTRVVDVRAIAKGRAKDVVLSDGDVVNIPESWF